MLLRSAGGVFLAFTFSLSAFAQAVPFPNTTTWTSIGPTKTLWGASNQWPETSGRIKSIAIDPSGTVYIGAAVGGVWKLGSGNMWTPLTDFQASLASGAIAIDPNNSNTIYVGTGEVPDGLADYSGGGLLKSTDGGATWINVIGPFLDLTGNNPQAVGGQVPNGARFAALAVSPTNPNVLLGAVEIGPLFYPNSGIFRSSDGGLNWTPVLTGNVGSSVLFDPTNGNIAYAALGSNLKEPVAGIYKSTDGGVTWNLLTGSAQNPLPTTNVGMIRLAIAPSNPQVLYAGIADNGTNLGSLLGLYTTSDGGANWMQLNATPDYCTFQCYYDHALAVHPTNPNILVAGGDGFNGNLLYITTDGGMHWNEIAGVAPNRLHDDVQSIAFSPDGSTLYVATDGGIASSTTFTAATTTWNFINNNLEITQFYSGFALDPTTDNRLFAGTQDNGFQLFDTAYIWNVVTGGEGGNILYDGMTNTVYLVGATLAWTEFGYYGYASSSNGLNFSEPHAYNPPLEFDLESNGAVQYTGTNRVYQTVNAQGTWTPISPVLAGMFGYVTAIAMAPSSPNQVCAGTSDGHFWCTMNANLGASSTWTEYSTGLPGRFITRVSVNQFHANEVALSFSGLTEPPGDTQGHIFFSSNTGGTWTDISGNLPNTPANDVFTDPSDATGVYAATDQGVFRTLDGGATWAPLAIGLPHTVVTGLNFERFSRLLTITTMGRSMWRLTVPVVTAAPGPTPSLSNWTINFSVHFGGPDPPPQTVSVINAGSPTYGTTPLNWTATPMPAFGGNWLSATPGNGTDNAPVNVSVDVTGLPLGRYNGVVRVTGPGATNDPVDLTVQLSVTDTAPQAVAPASQTVDSTSPSGAQVTLNGSASSDPDNDPLTYLWTWVSGKASGPDPTVTLPIGVNTITLTVTDPAGLSSTAATTVTVLSPSGMTSNLISTVQALGFQQGASLLQSALSAIQKGNSNAACGKLNAFENQVGAQSGKQLTIAQAAQLTTSASDITGTLGCK